jgi:hypothetical protein
MRQLSGPFSSKMIAAAVMIRVSSQDQQTTAVGGINEKRTLSARELLKET